MGYQCPKGHISSDPDYCSECGARIGQPAASASYGSSSGSSSAVQEICPDCGTPRVGNDRFCEVCRHDFIEGKTGTAEKVIEAGQPPSSSQPALAGPPASAGQPVLGGQSAQTGAMQESVPQYSADAGSQDLNPVSKAEIVIGQKLNIIISVDEVRLAQNQIETSIKPDSRERVFPLDLDENLVGRRSVSKGIYPEIEINDPGVSHRHLKFIKQPDGAFAVLELGSANGTEYNGMPLEPGICTVIKAGDEFAIGLWTTLKVSAR